MADCLAYLVQYGPAGFRAVQLQVGNRREYRSLKVEGDNAASSREQGKGAQVTVGGGRERSFK